MVRLLMAFLLLLVLPAPASGGFLGGIKLGQLTPPPFAHKSPAQLVNAIGNEAAKAGVTQQGAVDSLSVVKDATAHHVAQAQRGPGMAAEAALSSGVSAAASAGVPSGVDLDLDRAERQARQTAGNVQHTAGEVAGRARSSAQGIEDAAAKGVAALTKRKAGVQQGASVLEGSRPASVTGAPLEASFRPESSVRRDWSSLSGLPVMFVLFGVAYVWAQRRKADRLKSLEQLSQALAPEEARKPIIQVAPPQDWRDLEVLKA